MLVYILIFGLAVISTVIILWYFDPLNHEGFQTAKRTYEIVRPTDYSGIGGQTQISSANAILAQEACDAAPGCIGFLYYAGIAYLTMDTVTMSGRSLSTQIYDTGSNNITNTLVGNNPTQKFMINAKRRYVRVLPSPSSGGWVGISQVVILDHNGNNLAQGRSTYSPSTGAGNTEKVIDADTSTIVNSSYTNTVWGNPVPMWLGGNPNGYLEIDLGDIVNISSITIYYRADDPNNIPGTRVIASNSSADSGGSLNWWKEFGSLPGQGQFILTAPSIDQTITANYSGRYVRIMPSLMTWNGDGKLSISSIIVKDQGGNNVSLGKPTYITNPDSTSQPVANLVSGSTVPTLLVSTAGNRLTDYVEIDLGSVVNISTIRIIGGSNCCFPGQSSYVSNRQTGLRIKISTTTDSAAEAAYSAAVVYRFSIATVPNSAIPASEQNSTTKKERFWELVDKIDRQQDTDAIEHLSKVKDPDPNDPNDLMPVYFSKYESISALAMYTGLNWEVISNQCRDGSNITGVTGTVDQGKATCKATPGCTEFTNYQGVNYFKKVTLTSLPLKTLAGCTTYKYTSDISGARAALFTNNDGIHDWMASLNTPTRMGCASLEELRDKYILKYNALIKSVQDLSGQAINAGNMREENLAYQMSNLASCKDSPSTACISLANQEPPVFSLLAKFDNVNNTMASSGFLDLSDNINTINAVYTRMGCKGAALKFSPNDIGIIDTQTLIMKLNQMSPYYLSPDTLQYITSSIISSEEMDKSLMTNADKLANITNVITNIKSLTGTS